MKNKLDFTGLMEELFPQKKREQFASQGPQSANTETTGLIAPRSFASQQPATIDDVRKIAPMSVLDESASTADFSAQSPKQIDDVRAGLQSVAPQTATNEPQNGNPFASIAPQNPAEMNQNPAMPVDENVNLNANSNVGSAIAPQRPSQMTQGKIDEIFNKDYSIRKDENGNVVHRGKDRDKKWSTGEKVVNSILGFFEGLGQGGGLIGGAYRAVKAGTDRNYMEKRRDARDLNKYGSQLAGQQQQEKFDASIASAKINDEYDLARIADLPLEREYKQSILDERRDSREDRIKATALNKLNSLKHYDPKNAAHTTLAKEAGIDPATLQGWDDRNNTFKQVAGITYQYNRQTGAFEQTNLPTDESKVLTDYKVQMPNGEMRTYRVSQKDAANFATQMQALGARLAQDESQFQRTLIQRSKEFKFAREKWTETLKLRRDAMAQAAEARASGDANRAAQLDIQIQRLDEQMTNNRVFWQSKIGTNGFTQEDYDKLISEQP